MESAPSNSVVNHVTSEVRAAILTGELPPGMPFSINALQKQLNVSHIPVREALRRLESENLVELRPGRSALVKGISAEDAKEIYRLRRIIEVDLAGRASEHYSDSDFASAESYLEIMARISDGGGELYDFWLAHTAFHRVLLEPAGGDWSIRLLEPLWVAAQRYLRLIYDPEVGLGRLTAAHREILEVAKSRSGEQLKEVLAEHLDRSAHRVVTEVERRLADMPEAPMTRPDRGAERRLLIGVGSAPR